MPPVRPLRFAVVGGANTDIAGHSLAPLVPRDSNPAHVSTSAGGVGRNIAENLVRLGHRVSLVTAFGGDHNAAELRRHAQAAGIDTAASITCEDLPGSVYLAVLDADGDMALAASDMRAIDRLVPAALEAAVGELAAANVIVCDTNVPQATLVWVAGHVAAPLVLDPVSVAKAPRAVPVLSHLAALKCNVAEAQAITEEHDEHDPEALAAHLLATGVPRVFVTDGAQGVVALDHEGMSRHAAPKNRVENATGAGDAFTAGVAAALAHGASTPVAAAWGTALAGLTLGSAATVSPAVDPQAFKRAVEELT